MATVQDRLDEIKRVVDVDDTQALRLFNDRYLQMVGESLVREISTVQPTVADDNFYLVYSSGTPDGIVEIREVLVDGVPYDRATRRDIDLAAVGGLTIEGFGGIYAPGSTRGLSLYLYPTPSESGLDIEVRFRSLPAEATAATNVTDLQVDLDLVRALVEGACATELARIGEGDPDRLEALFAAAVEKQRRRARRRFRGRGVTQVRIRGINA